MSTVFVTTYLTEMLSEQQDILLSIFKYVTKYKYNYFFFLRSL